MWGDSKARRRRSSASKKSKKKQDQGASFSSVTDIDLSLAVQGKNRYKKTSLETPNSLG